ncbi:MAG: hypothetical protein IJA85_06375 [Clostridia bacterium]|nr:hypothetical protein [Clostridia bacterium]
MENQTLLLTNWKLAGFWPYTPFRYGAELNNTLDSQTGWIDAQVPGSVYTDLERAGMIKDPYFEMNALSCEWVANRWWAYQSEFVLSEDFGDGHYRLVCKGIDYKATVYFNGEKIGEHEGMFIPFEKDVTELVKRGGENNRVVIVLESVPDEMGQIGYTSRTRTQRSRFYYKWDFCTRMVGVGLYDPVMLEYVPKAEMRERRIETECTGDSWELHAEVLCSSHKAECQELRACLFEGDRPVGEAVSAFDAVVGEQTVSAVISGLHPELWWPNGYGEAKLYNLKLELWSDGKLLHQTEHPVGFRRIEYAQAEGRCDDSLPYQPVINGKRIYIKGVNLVPLDHRQGTVDKARYTTFLDLCRKCGGNLVRIWGGGVIEREEFYRICDEKGILVWQEFIQSSSGLESAPSTDPTFLALLKKVAEYSVKYIRNHASIAFFSGGNELFEIDEQGKWHPCNYNNPNIAMLKSVVDGLDGRTIMLPTSASGPNDVIYLDRPGLNHDVHGPWKLYGPQYHYDLFNGSDAILQSEFGCDGFSCYESLQKFLSAENLKVDTAKNNTVWRYHGEWWDSYEQRERPIFGDFEKDDLKTLIKCNQFMQAEGIRYALEANRRRAHKNVGSIIWQFNEPWPNVFCTCIVDYYATPKLAYYAVADAFASRTLLLRYSNILQSAGSSMTIGIGVANDLEACEGRLTFCFKDHTGAVFASHALDCRLDENAVTILEDYELTIPAHVNRGFTIETELVTDSGTVKKIYTILTKGQEDAVYDREIAIAHYDRIMTK